MPIKQLPTPSERRSFFSSLNAGLISLAAMAAGGAALAQEKPKAAARFEPVRHDKDEWLELPGKHRLVFDSSSIGSAGEAIYFSNNFMRTNRSDYALQNSDLAVVIILRHNSTAFGYNDAMWAKYGTAIAGRTGVEDPRSKQPPKVNMFNAAEYGELLTNKGVTLDAVSKLGVQMAVCAASTRANAGVIAKAAGSETDAIYNELTANLVSNARMVPAGIVTVCRAQERGYSLVTTL